MRTCFSGPCNDPREVFYTRCSIDLPSHSVRIEDVPCRNLEDVLGGFGRSFQMLAERTVTHAFTPANPLIVNIGVLTGTNLMTGLRTYFSAYSPLKVSNRGLPAAMWATGSCKFGPKLRWTGLDEMVLEGRSNRPVLVVVQRGIGGPAVAFQPADHLLGLDCHGKIMRLHEQFPDAHFAVIGPAGENYESCYFAGVALSTENQLKSRNDKCRWAGRGGMGAIMGFKNVIGIVAQASDQVTRLKPEIRDINKEASGGPGSRKFREKEKGGLGGTWSNYVPLEEVSFVPQHNFRPTGDGRARLMFRETVEPEFVIKAESCFRCGISCHKNVYEKNPDGTRGRFLAKFDYEPVNLLSTNIGIDDPRKAAELISLVDQFGMDSISLGATIAYVLDYNDRHPSSRILNGATFGDFEKVKELVEGTGKGRFPEIGRGVKRLSEQLGEPGYAMHCKGLELPAYLPDTNPGYPWAIAGGHMSMATHLSLVLERDTSVGYWVKAITERGLYFVRDDLLGLCKFAALTAENAAQAVKHEIGLEITAQELLAAVRRAFIRALWLERKQGYERADYTLPSEVFDRPNTTLGIGPFVTREFFSELSDRVWSVFDPEIAAL
ncbi:MAG: aldehyde:ferredoxin oxidoreductase [Acidobacteria bacterium]|nr:aldehyde:ferredoxin oxidoreductase [Acidobacteriota bacterium]